MKKMCGILAITGLMAALQPAHAGSSATMSDPEVYDAVIERSSNSCYNYPGKKAEPDIRKIPIGALRGAYERKVMICPNLRLTGDPAVVWYGPEKAIVWNPDKPAAAGVMNKQLDQMATDKTYPAEVKSWTVDGTALTNQMLPQFQLACSLPENGDCGTH